MSISELFTDPELNGKVLHRANTQRLLNIAAGSPVRLTRYLLCIRLIGTPLNERPHIEKILTFDLINLDRNTAANETVYVEALN